jgi:hypothetical protein
MADEPGFELISKVMDASATVRFKYGSGPHDPRPFVLTLLPQYVARELGKTLPLRIGDITKYVQDHADALKAMARFEWDQGRTSHRLD